MVVEAEKKSSEKSIDKELMYTADRALLLACVYFDQSHVGYLLDKDVEDIIHVTGLQLSRAQVELLCVYRFSLVVRMYMLVGWTMSVLQQLFRDCYNTIQYHSW